MTFPGIGGLAAARDLSKTVSFSELSFAKTLEQLGKSIDLTEEPNEGEDVPASMEKQRRRMLEESRNFRDFEALLVVLDALQEWRRLVPPTFVVPKAYSSFDNANFDSAEKELMVDHERMRGVRQATQEAYITIKPAMDSLLDDWLNQPADGMSATSFYGISTNFLHRARSTRFHSNPKCMPARSHHRLYHFFEPLL